MQSHARLPVLVDYELSLLDTASLVSLEEYEDLNASDLTLAQEAFNHPLWHTGSLDHISAKLTFPLYYLMAHCLLHLLELQATLKLNQVSLKPTLVKKVEGHG